MFMDYLLRFLGAAADNIRLNYPKVFLFLFLPLLWLSCNKKDTPSDDYSDQFKLIFNKTTYYFDNNQLGKGIQYLDSAFKTIKNPTLDDRFRRYGFHYVYAQKIKHDNREELLYADSMMVLAQQSVTKQQYVSNFAEANYAKGDAYFRMNQYNDAYQCYFQGYQIGKNYMTQMPLSDYTYRMGMIMYKQARYRMAADYFKESYRQSFLIRLKAKDIFP